MLFSEAFIKHFINEDRTYGLTPFIFLKFNATVQSVRAIEEFYGLEILDLSKIVLNPIFSRYEHNYKIPFVQEKAYPFSAHRPILHKSSFPARYFSYQPQLPSFTEISLLKCINGQLELTNNKYHTNSPYSGLIFRPYSNLLKILTRLMEYENLFPTQKFLKYFDMDKAVKELDYINNHEWVDNTIRLKARLPEDQIFDFTKYGYPTYERITFLIWKKYLSDFCSHHIFITNFDFLFISKINGLINHYNDLKIIKGRMWDHITSSEKSFQRRVSTPDGQVIKVYVHRHELDVYVSENSLPLLPPNIHTAKRDFYKGAIDNLFEKKIHYYTNKFDFYYVPKENISVYADQYIPIKDSLELIREGTRMTHCIGGERYIAKGKNKVFIYFRFIPFGVDVSDFKNHFTVTLSKCRIRHFANANEVNKAELSNVPCYEDEDDISSIWHQVMSGKNRKKSVWYLHEVWGWDNKIPSDDVLKEIYGFLYQNRTQFKVK